MQQDDAPHPAADLKTVLTSVTNALLKTHASNLQVVASNEQLSDAIESLKRASVTPPPIISTTVEATTPWLRVSVLAAAVSSLVACAWLTGMWMATPPAWLVAVLP
jgi:hypothetical protein